MIDAVRDKVAIVGMGCTKFGEHWDKSFEDLVCEAAWEAFEDAGIEPEQIEAAWLSTAFRTAGAFPLTNSLKLDGKPVTRVENQCASPLDALRNATFAVACGAYDLVLVVGVEKMKDTGYRGIQEIAEWCTNFGILASSNTAPGGFGLIALTYFARYGATKEHLAKIAVKNHRNGSLHPKAHFRREITLEQAMNAPIVAWPLGLFDCCPTTDGASAAILTRRELAKNFRKDYILIGGIGISSQSNFHFYKTGFDYLDWLPTAMAAKQAYEQAGIKEPFKELDIVELHDCFSITELVSYEDLGLCRKGEAKDFIDNGVFELGGELPVNTDGGLKAFGHPVGASGLRMIYEIYHQFQGKAGARQLKSPQVGLAHNIGGAPFVAGVAIVHSRI